MNFQTLENPVKSLCPPPTPHLRFTTGGKKSTELNYENEMMSLKKCVLNKVQLWVGYIDHPLPGLLSFGLHLSLNCLIPFFAWYFLNKVSLKTLHKSLHQLYSVHFQILCEKGPTENICPLPFNRPMKMRLRGVMACCCRAAWYSGLPLAD